MSRDFELLQRLEREWGGLSAFPASNGNTVPVVKQAEVLKIAQYAGPDLAHPGADLAGSVRGELTRLVFGTFLASPARKVVMFTGVEAGEYAKWTAACTADILADIGRARVCLLDADLRVPTIHRLYSLPNTRGLVDMLADGCTMDRAATRAGENLWVIPAGTQPGDRPTALAKFQQVVSDILDQCEYIVVAAPDCGSYAEISALGQATEGAVLVLDAGKTRRATAQDAKASLEIAKVRVLGSVLSNATPAETETSYLRK